METLDNKCMVIFILICMLTDYELVTLFYVYRSVSLLRIWLDGFNFICHVASYLPSFQKYKDHFEGR